MARGTPNSPLTGPLAPVEAGFTAHLVRLGYTPNGIAGQRALVAHLDRWLSAAGMTVAELTPAAVERFLQARAAAGYATKLTEQGLAPLLEYLEQIGRYRRPAPPATNVDEIVSCFHRHLLEERGVGRATAGNYERVARRFLAACPAPLEANLIGLTARDVTAFVVAQHDRLSVAAMQTVVQGLRALLTFLYLAGLTNRPLTPAVPTVARRRPDLPRALPEEHLALLLEGCERTTPVGLRDFAILTVLARLGLRADEVAHLELDDIDWRAGELRVRGKGPRIDKLPLPSDVGEAIVEYFRHARPKTAERRLFIRTCAPRRGLSRQAVGGLVRAASLRAGLAPHGPHRLRHTVATGLLRRGAPLAEIAQLLRHQSVQTTVTYAKVDLGALSGLAQPWPGALE
jgi:site-specific recombinase XerD